MVGRNSSVIQELGSAAPPKSKPDFGYELVISRKKFRALERSPSLACTCRNHRDRLAALLGDGRYLIRCYIRRVPTAYTYLPMMMFLEFVVLNVLGMHQNGMHQTVLKWIPSAEEFQARGPWGMGQGPWAWSVPKPCNPLRRLISFTSRRVNT